MTPNRHTTRKRATRRARPCAPILKLFAVTALTATLLAACGGSRASTPTATPRANTGASTSIAAAAPSPTATRAPSPTVTATSPVATATRAPAPQVASPAGSPTPIPMPAPSIGTAVTSQGWEITVTDVATYQHVGDYTANGTFLYVMLTVKNTGSNAAAFPYDGLIVVDANGASYVIDVPATKETLTYDKGVDLFAQFEAGSSHAVASVFDIALDATGLKLTTPSHVFSIVLDYAASPK